jgi:stage II sporulation protein R
MAEKEVFMKLKGLLIFSTLVLTVSVLCSALPVNGEVGLYDKVVRLHVIAESDSEADQALKLAVRDAVLCEVAQLAADAADAGEAKAAIEESKDALRLVCERTLSEHGSDSPVALELGREKYPVCEYDGVTLPSGDYYSVRVKIGEAKGRNWWCVLFPPLCVGAATDKAEVMAAAGLTRDEVDVITGRDGGYVLRFRIIEFFRRSFSAN